MDPDRIFVTIFKGTNLAKGEEKEWSRAELIACLTEHKKGAKDEMGLVVGRFEGGRRNSASLFERRDLTFDIDSGHSEEEVRLAVEKLGYGAIVSSTYSHGKAQLSVAKPDYEKHIAAGPDESPESYLIKKKHLQPGVAAGATAKVDGKGRIIIQHAPCPRWRITIPAEQPFTFNGKDSIETWKTIYKAVGERLGLQYDTSCSDPTRLFYVPRIPDRPFLPPKWWQQEGAPLNFQALITQVPSTQKRVPPAKTAARPLSDTGLPIFEKPEWRNNRPKINAALNAIPADAVYPEWIEVGMALHDCSGGAQEALEVWDKWSRTESVKYKKGECASKWKTFGKSSGSNVGIGTLYKIAKEHGWKWGQTPCVTGSAPQDENCIDDFYTSVKEIRQKPLQVEWVIPGYFERDTVALIHGPYGAFKSLMVQDLMMRKSAGMIWAGVMLKRGACLYIQGEGQGGLHRRIEAFGRHHKIRPDSDIPFFASKTSIDLNSDQSVEYVVSKTAKIEEQSGMKVELICIDTLAANFGAGDENSTKDMARFLNQVNEVRRRTGAAILIVHHEGHSDKGRARGAIALPAGVDSVYRISSPRELMARLDRPSKMKDGTPPPETWFKAEIINLGMDADCRSMTSLVLEHAPGFEAPPATQKTKGHIQQLFLKQISAEGITVEDLKKSYAALRGGKYSKQGFHQALATFKNSGCAIEKDGKLFRREVAEW